MREFQIIEGDALTVLRGLEPCSFDACLCDPPYGLAFMGKAWDHGVPGADVWAEVRRVLKGGAPLLAFGGTRTFHRLACAIEDAGLALADTLCWLHGQGFPKGHAQLKPAWEPITLAWKPGTRMLNIEGGRLPLVGIEEHATPSKRKPQSGVYGGGWADDNSGKDLVRYTSAGRWPANVILDKESAALVDAQTGELSSGFMAAGTPRNNRMGYNGAMPPNTAAADTYGDSGGASRFFYIAKADTAERNIGGVRNNHPTVKPVDLCAYLAKLILPPQRETPRRLLVPFSGSGSEIMGALRAGWDEAVGIDSNPEYVTLARRRIEGDAPLFNTAALQPEMETRPPAAQEGSFSLEPGA